MIRIVIVVNLRSWCVAMSMDIAGRAHRKNKQKCKSKTGKLHPLEFVWALSLSFVNFMMIVNIICINCTWFAVGLLCINF